MLFKSVWEVMNSARALVPLHRLRTKERVQRMYVNTSRRRHRSAREKEGKKKKEIPFMFFSLIPNTRVCG